MTSKTLFYPELKLVGLFFNYELAITNTGKKLLVNFEF